MTSAAVLSSTGNWLGSASARVLADPGFRTGRSARRGILRTGCTRGSPARRAQTLRAAASPPNSGFIEKSRYLFLGGRRYLCRKLRSRTWARAAAGILTRPWLRRSWRRRGGWGRRARARAAQARALLRALPRARLAGALGPRAGRGPPIRAPTRAPIPAPILSRASAGPSPWSICPSRPSRRAHLRRGSLLGGLLPRARRPGSD